MYTIKQILFKSKFLILFVSFFYLPAVFSQVTFEKEVKISDKGLFFDGEKVAASRGVPNAGPKYDFAFGSRITPHGDCVKEYKGFVFMTWYRGGKNDRHVMLSRYNTNTGVTKTIEFGHRHNGFQNVPHIGESHNTIAIGIAPVDGTIHMVYDIHAYDEDRPSDGSLANDYFRYTFSKKDAATVPDNQFNINQFVKDSDGDYKHLTMRRGTDYRSLTYPNFFVNKEGELFMWLRTGGNTNGAYQFCKYSENGWSDFNSFNVMGARRRAGVDHNWGLYGDIKFSGGKMRIAFARRSGNNTDKFRLNNGLYYAYTDDPDGLNQWRDANDRPVSLPIYDSEILKVSEPTDVLGINSGVNTVNMTRGTDWTVTDRGDIHAVTTVGSGNTKTNVHTYRKAGTNRFITTTDFPGGNLYNFRNEVYLIGLGGGNVFVEKTDGGTNNWTRIYQARSDKRFRHGNVHISPDGKLYFYMMQQTSGSAQPLYLQIFDLGLDLDEGNKAPIVNLTSPTNNATFELGQEITLSANSSDPDGNLEKVNFLINDDFYRTDAARPFSTTFTPTEVGTYKITARAIDKENAKTDDVITIIVEEGNNPPVATFIAPTSPVLLEEGYTELYVNVSANDPDGDNVSLVLSIDGEEIRTEGRAPYEWGHEGSPNLLETLGLTEGEHTLEVVVTDTEGASTTISRTVTVTARNVPPAVVITSPVNGDIYSLGEEVILSARDVEGNVEVVNFKVDSAFYSRDALAPFEGSFLPTEAGTYVIGARAFDANNQSTEVTVSITVENLITANNEEIDSEAISVFPNPSKTGVFHLNQEASWEVFNMHGIKVANGEEELIDLSSQMQGVYFIKANDSLLKLMID